MFPEDFRIDLLDLLRRKSICHEIGFSISAFGSRSYGDSAPQSDIDLFFVAREDNLQAVEGETVMSKLGFKEDGVFYSTQDLQELRSHIIDLCQVDKILLGIRADIHMTTVEIIRDGFLGSEARRSFWNKFKQPFSKDYHYTLSTFNSKSIVYQATYRNITAESYVKESPSVIPLDDGDATVGHLLDKLLTSRMIYDCPIVEATTLIEHDLWVHFLKSLCIYSESFRMPDNQVSSSDASFQDVRNLLYRHERFSHKFELLLKTRFYRAFGDL